MTAASDASLTVPATGAARQEILVADTELKAGLEGGGASRRICLRGRSADANGGDMKVGAGLIELMARPPVSPLTVALPSDPGGAS
jgi:hypothetical protein